MDRFPAELIYLAILGVVTLLHYVLKRFVWWQQSQQQTAPDQPQTQTPETVKQTPTTQPPSRSTTRHFVQRQAPTKSPVPARHRFSRSALTGNRRDLQNAIVLATILGPCRAFESPADPHS
jgi:cytoskeletal protein RodZ